MTSDEEQFDADMKSSVHFEASLLWREIIALLLVVALVVARQLWFV
jgi:hypothetical protein